jgi:23S rRNA (cytidine1920-2'-O)/16S rRNA (cytidine1409-2'-O)-methyltransferase
MCEGASVKMTEKYSTFASRAGLKLEHALNEFKVDVAGLVCADLGSNVGGFVDCLLKRGAKKVYAIESGHGILNWNLRNDPRVIVMEKTNALHVELPELVDFISIDVAWTKQKLILGAAKKLLKPGGRIVTLVKPHYEAGPKALIKGKLPPEAVESSVAHVKATATELGFQVHGLIESPIVGSKAGNKEYLMFLSYS